MPAEIDLAQVAARPRHRPGRLLPEGAPLRSLNRRPVARSTVPVMEEEMSAPLSLPSDVVPVVPMLETKWVIFPSVSRQISGAVPS